MTLTRRGALALLLGVTLSANAAEPDDRLLVRRLYRCLRQDSCSRAWEDLEARTRRDPRPWLWFEWSARLAETAGEFDSLHRRTESEARTGRGDPWPCVRLALLTDDLEERRARLQTAIDRDAGCVYARVLLAESLRKRGREDEARRELASALELDPLDATARRERARQIAERDPMSAVLDLEAALPELPPDADDEFQLAELLMRLDRLADAADAVDRGLYLDPEADRGAVVVIRLDRRRDRGDHALERIERRRSEGRTLTAELRAEEIELLIEEGKLDLAERRWQEISEQPAVSPSERARLGADLAWARRDPDALGRHLEAWSPAERPARRSFYRGCLAYLEGDLPALETALADAEGPDASALEELRSVLMGREERMGRRGAFLVGLSVILAALLLFLLRAALRSRPSPPAH